MFGITLAAIGGTLLSFTDAGKKSLSTIFSPEMMIPLMFSFAIATNLSYLQLFGEHDLTAKRFSEAQVYRDGHGLMLKEGTIFGLFVESSWCQ